jgi:hypothetical protein
MEEGPDSIRKRNRSDLKFALGRIGVSDVVLFEHENLIPTQGSRPS